MRGFNFQQEAGNDHINTVHRSSNLGMLLFAKFKTWEEKFQQRSRSSPSLCCFRYSAGALWSLHWETPTVSSMAIFDQYLSQQNWAGGERGSSEYIRLRAYNVGYASEQCLLLFLSLTHTLWAVKSLLPKTTQIPYRKKVRGSQSNLLQTGRQARSSWMLKTMHSAWSRKHFDKSQAF